MNPAPISNRTDSISIENNERRRERGTAILFTAGCLRQTYISDVPQQLFLA